MSTSRQNSELQSGPVLARELERPVDELLSEIAAQLIAAGARRLDVVIEGASASVTANAAIELSDVEPIAAASARMAVEIAAGGRRRSAVFSRGEPIGGLRDHGPATATRTRLSLLLDPALTGDRHFDPGAVRSRLESMCLRHPGVRVRVDGRAASSLRGLSGLIDRRAGGDALHPHPLRFAGLSCGVQVDIAARWRASGPLDVRCVVDSAEREIEAAVVGFRAGLLDAAGRADISDAVVAELLEPGLVAIVALAGSSDPDDIGPAVREVAGEGLGAHRAVIDRVLAIRCRSALG